MGEEEPRRQSGFGELRRERRREARREARRELAKLRKAGIIVKNCRREIS